MFAPEIYVCVFRFNSRNSGSIFMKNLYENYATQRYKSAVFYNLLQLLTTWRGRELARRGLKSLNVGW
jgi:hypothetical protein